MMMSASSLAILLQPAIQRNPSLRMDILERCVGYLIRALNPRMSAGAVQKVLKMQLCLEVTEQEVEQFRAYVFSRPRQSPSVSEIIQQAQIQAPVRFPRPVWRYDTREFAALSAVGPFQAGAELKVLLPVVDPA